MRQRWGRFNIPIGIRPSPEKALVTAPAFAEYEEALAQTGTEIVFHELGESPVTKTFLEKLSPDLELVFLCNPNNPTGLLTEKALIRELLERSRKLGIRVLLDECFLDFVPEEKAYTASDLLEEYPNLVILKSFTKLLRFRGCGLVMRCVPTQSCFCGCRKPDSPGRCRSRPRQRESRR